MNNTEIIKGIERTIEGLNLIKGALAGAVEEPKKEAKTTAKTPKKAEPVAEPVEETAEAVDTNTTYTMEELSAMKYNEFKKLASSLGVKCTGTRKQILDRIIELGVVAEESESEPVEEEAPVEEKKEPKKSADTKAGKKLGKKKADEEAETEDEFDEQAREIAEETAVEDIIEALADVDVKATKKNAVKKLAEALRNGLIELDDEDEDSEEAGAEDDEDTTEASADSIEPDSYFPEYDFYDVNDPEDMTEERASAIAEKMEEILTAYPDDLTEEDVQSYLEDNATEEQLEALGEDYEDLDLLKMYMELVKCTIDNDGEEAEQGEPYEIGEKNFCCGHELKYVKKTKKYVCEHCGEEYEAE